MHHVALIGTGFGRCLWKRVFIFLETFLDGIYALHRPCPTHYSSDFALHLVPFLWVNSHFFIFMHENMFSCISIYFGANFVLVLARDVCGLV